MADISAGEVLGGMALAALVVKEAFALVRSRLITKNDNGTINGKAGEKTVSFWRNEFREAQVSGNSTTIMPALNRQTEILEKMSDGITRLVLIEELRQRKE